MREHLNCHSLFLNKVQKIKSSCLIKVPFTVSITKHQQKSLSKSSAISAPQSISLIMALTPQHFLPHTPGDTSDGQDASTPCPLP